MMSSDQPILAAEVQAVFNESAKILTGIVSAREEIAKVQKFCSNLIAEAQDEV